VENGGKRKISVRIFLRNGHTFMARPCWTDSTKSNHELNEERAKRIQVQGQVSMSTTNYSIQVERRISTRLVQISILQLRRLFFDTFLLLSRAIKQPTQTRGDDDGKTQQPATMQSHCDHRINQSHKHRL
jgi:hypothetical protein